MLPLGMSTSRRSNSILTMKYNFVSRGGVLHIAITRSLPEHLLSAVGAPVDDTVGVESLKRCMPSQAFQGTCSHKQIAFRKDI